MNLPVVASQNSPVCQICLRSRQFSKYHQNFFWPPWNHVKQNEYPKVQIQTLEGQVSLTLWKLRWSLHCWTVRDPVQQVTSLIFPQKSTHRNFLFCPNSALKKKIYMYIINSPQKIKTPCVGFQLRCILIHNGVGFVLLPRPHFTPLQVESKMKHFTRVFSVSGGVCPPY